jgi:hypothetical protein
VSLQADEDDVVREIVNGKLPNIRVANTRHYTARTWKRLEMPECLPDLISETPRNIFISLGVPIQGFPEFAPSALT